MGNSVYVYVKTLDIISFKVSVILKYQFTFLSPHWLWDTIHHFFYKQTYLTKYIF